MIDTVQGFYREVVRLNDLLADELQAGEHPLARVTSRDKQGKNEDRLMLRHAYASLFGDASFFDSGDDDEEDAGQSDDDEGAEEDSGSRTPVELPVDTRLLLVRVALRDTTGLAGEPEVQYVVLKSPQCESIVAGSTLSLKRHQLRRIQSGVRPQSVKGERVLTKARALKDAKGKKGGNRISFELEGPVEREPLFGLDSPTAVVDLASRIKNNTWLKGVP